MLGTSKICEDCQYLRLIGDDLNYNKYCVKMHIISEVNCKDYKRKNIYAL